MSEILYKELSYEIVGALFDAIKTLGANYHEKYCQRAVEVFLKKRNIPYEKEYPVELFIDQKHIGRHFLDFLIDDKVVLEIKKGSTHNISDIKQVLMYLKTTKKRLGILAYFGTKGVIYKRIVNSDLNKVS